MKFETGILDDDDMNHLKNKCIHLVADLLQDQLGLALGRLQHAVQKTIRRDVALLDIFEICQIKCLHCFRS